MREGFHAGRALLRRSWIGDQEKKLEEITAQERLERVRVMRVCVCVFVSLCMCVCICVCVCVYCDWACVCALYARVLLFLCVNLPTSLLFMGSCVSVRCACIAGVVAWLMG